jgi:hypothetical protein
MKYGVWRYAADLRRPRIQTREKVRA